MSIVRCAETARSSVVPSVVPRPRRIALLIIGVRVVATMPHDHRSQRDQPRRKEQQHHEQLGEGGERVPQVLVALRRLLDRVRSL